MPGAVPIAAMIAVAGELPAGVAVARSGQA